MTPLAVTAITDFILAAEVMFLTGMLLGKSFPVTSSAFSWGLAMLFMGISALLGGIDHGFLENRVGNTIRTIAQRLTWFFIGLMITCTLVTLAWQFLPSGYYFTVYVIALAQLAVFIFLIIRYNNFLVVVINYAPVMLIFLAFHILGLHDGSGSIVMVAGLLLSFVAAVVQVMKIDVLSPLDHNGVYHVIMMIAVYFLYLGGLQLGS
ncbi:MAG TPA: hypothetical protein VKQ10_00380 [Spirochaetota bacterium]|nr:hypothetical protein [Spirochaetota bacterium]